MSENYHYKEAFVDDTPIDERKKTIQSITKIINSEVLHSSALREIDELSTHFYNKCLGQINRHRNLEDEARRRGVLK